MSGIESGEVELMIPSPTFAGDFIQEDRPPCTFWECGRTMGRWKRFCFCVQKTAFLLSAGRMDARRFDILSEKRVTCHRLKLMYSVGRVAFIKVWTLPVMCLDYNAKERPKRSGE